MTDRTPFRDPSSGPTPPLATSCEHCLTVTWAGRPACSCEFGLRATDEELTWRLRLGVLESGGAAD